MLTLKQSQAIEDIADRMRIFLEEIRTDEEFLEFARSIIADSPAYDNDQLKIILEYVRQNVQYVRDPAGTELLTSPHRMMLLIKQGAAYGDCDCIAIFCTAICRAIGYNAWIVLLDQKGNGYNHAACEVYSEATNLVYYMDPTLDDSLHERILIAGSHTTDEPGSIFTLGYKYKMEVR